MIRFLLRILGLWLVALALVALVIDATGSIAASAWVFSAPLPSARSLLSGASINNRVIISGEG